MAANENKVLINLATGLEDTERVTVAFLVAGAALEQGKRAAMFLTKEAIRLGLDGYAVGVACEALVPTARLGGATPLWEWIGESATVFSS